MSRTSGTVLCGALAALLAACGSSSSGGGTKNPTWVQNVPIPFSTSGSTVNFGFDIGGVSGSKYFVTDRNNKALDVFDTGSYNLVQIIPSPPNDFHGVDSRGNGNSGPDGANALIPGSPNTVYVGDVNSVKIVDISSNTVTKTIPIGGTSGFRADEGCYDPNHNLFMISSPEETPPFATFINTSTQAIVATVRFIDRQGQPTAGLEACVYDAANDVFWVNNDGTTDHPHGELVKLPGAGVRAIGAGATVNYLTVAGVAASDEGNCDPTGLALGPGNDIAVGCREGTTGAPLLMEFFDKTTGQMITSINAGGGDQLWYDSGSNRYYNAASRWTASGNAGTDGACSASSPCTPRLIVVDAATRSVVTMVPTGNNAHSVAVDSSTGKVFLPFSSPGAPAGCADCAANGFTPAGVAVYSIK